MIKFSAILLKFQEQGEKTGWTYIEVPAEIAQQLKPNNKKSFRVKGYFDDYYFEGLRQGSNRTAAFKQIGNAVPPLLSKTIADVFKNNSLK